MCFVNDYEWTADLVERWTETVEKEVHCDECYRAVPVGAVVHRVFMQEHEECRACFYDGDCECPEGECCKCEKPTFGETFDYFCCDECQKFLGAVSASEVEAGCRPSESLPSLSGMVPEINGGGMEEAKKYFKKARVLHPDLVRSGYLGWLWRKIF